MDDAPSQAVEPVIASRRVGTFGALAYPQFRLFWVSVIFMSLGMWVLNVAQMWLVQELTDSPIYLGLTNFANNIPLLLMSPLGGAVADRMDRRKLILVARFLTTVIALVLALLVATRLIQVWHILVLAVLMGTVLSFDIPARQAILPNLVPRPVLMNAISLTSAVFASTSVLGPGFAGPLIGLFGTGFCFYVTAAVYAAMWVIFFKIRPIDQVQHDRRESLIHSMAGGARYVKNEPTIAALMAVSAVSTVFGGSFQTLLPRFAEHILHGDAGTYGLLLASTGVGAFLGTIALAAAGDLRFKGRWIFAVAIGFGSGLVAFSLSHWLPVSVAVLLLVGCVNTLLWTLSSTMVQDIVPDAYRGRVMSFYMLTFGMMSLGGLLMGGLASAFGEPIAVTIGGAAVILGTAGVFLLRPALIRQ